MPKAPPTDLVADLPRHWAATQPDKVAFISGGRETTFRQVDDIATRIANGLRAAGVKKGDRFGYLGPNADRYYQVLLGGAKAGAVLVSLNWRLAPPELAHVIEDSGVEMIFVHPRFEELAAKAFDRLGRTVPTISTEEDFDHFLEVQSGKDPMMALEARDPVVQLYTSGTTGKPKGAVIPHIGLTYQSRSEEVIGGWCEWGDDEVNLVGLPTFHISGTAGGMTGFRRGATVVIMPQIDVETVIDFIPRYRVTRTLLVPAVLKMVLDHPKAEAADFSSMRVLSYGASPMPAQLMARAQAKFGSGFCQMYGMTENSGLATYLPPEDHSTEGNERMRSVGKAWPGFNLRVRKPDGTIAAPREVGEVEVNAPTTMIGYWKMPEATAETIDEEGWLATGDAGWLDEDGYLYLFDRVKDMIISGGENVYPVEVETCLLEHPGIDEVAVIGVPDEKWGEAVKAIIVPKGEPPLAEEIIAFAKERIAGYKAPKSVDFVDALPRNASGKVLRKDLRAPYWEGRDRPIG